MMDLREAPIATLVGGEVLDGPIHPDQDNPPLFLRIRWTCAYSDGREEQWIEEVSWDDFWKIRVDAET